ncbi:MAG: PqqD family protein [Anaerolineae bacterium]|jgi:hypothetical protein
MTEQLRPQVSDRIVFRKEGDDGLLFDPETGRIKVANYSARLVWELCDGTGTRDDIIAALRKEFDDVEDDVLRRDLDKLLGELEEWGWLTYREGEAG